MSKGSLVEQATDFRVDLEQARSRAEDAKNILDTIVFVVETAGQDCSNVTAMDHWLLVIDALARKAGNVLNSEEGGENTSNGGAP